MTEGYDFTNRTALVTGAASGIGAACARWLDRNGIGKLVLIDLNGDDLGKLGLSCEVESHQADVADEDFWQSLEPKLDRLDHAVVNAGIGTGGQIADLDFAEWRRVMAINLDGAFLTLATTLRAMQRSGGGSAVITASITGLKPVPGIGAYGVSKAAVAHMARIAAAENAGHGIRVNAIAPGFFRTELTAAVFDDPDRAARNAAQTCIGRNGEPEDLDGPLRFLCSDASRYVTGQVLMLDGGFTAK